MYDRDLKPYKGPFGAMWKFKMFEMPEPFPQVAERMIIASSWDEYYDMTRDVFEKDCITAMLSLYFIR